MAMWNKQGIVKRMHAWRKTGLSELVEMGTVPNIWDPLIDSFSGLKFFVSWCIDDAVCFVFGCFWRLRGSVYLVISGYSQDRSCIALCGLRNFNGNAFAGKNVCLPQKFHLLNFVDNFSWVGSTNSFSPGVVFVFVCVCVHYKLFLWHNSFGLVWSLVQSVTTISLVTGTIKVFSRRACLPGTPVYSDPSEKFQIIYVNIVFNIIWYLT